LTVNLSIFMAAKVTQEDKLARAVSEVRVMLAKAFESRGQSSERAPWALPKGNSFREFRDELCGQAFEFGGPVSESSAGFLHSAGMEWLRLNVLSDCVISIGYHPR